MENIQEKLIRRLKEPLPGIYAQQKLAPESRKIITPSINAIKAAIIILVYPDYDNCLKIVLIKRPSYNGHHSGQISFPGGKTETTDKNLESTAIRECHEEIGVNPNQISIVGYLTDLYIPVSNFHVTPFIGYCSETPVFKIDKNEVDYHFEIDIITLKSISIKHKYYQIENKNILIPYYNLNNEIVWGATSMILSEFIEVLNTL